MRPSRPSYERTICKWWLKSSKTKIRESELDQSGYCSICSISRFSISWKWSLRIDAKCRFPNAQFKNYWQRSRFRIDNTITSSWNYMISLFFYNLLYTIHLYFLGAASCKPQFTSRKSQTLIFFIDNFNFLSIRVFL